MGIECNMAERDFRKRVSIWAIPPDSRVCGRCWSFPPNRDNAAWMDDESYRCRASGQHVTGKTSCDWCRLFKRDDFYSPDCRASDSAETAEAKDAPLRPEGKR